jgi:hypothetical protein
MGRRMMIMRERRERERRIYTRKRHEQEERKYQEEKEEEADKMIGFYRQYFATRVYST